MLFRLGRGNLWIALNLFPYLCPFLFTLYAYPGNYVDIWTSLPVWERPMLWGIDMDNVFVSMSFFGP